jgi:Mce-associated membrane protein
VEDQQSDSGDLTTDGVPQGKSARRHRLPRHMPRQDEAEVVETGEVEPEAESEAATATEEQTVAEVETDAASSGRFPWSRRKAKQPEPVAVQSDSDSTDADGSPEPEPVLVPHRTAGRKLKLAAIAAGVVFVGAAAFAGATLQPYLADRAEVHTKFEVAETAANAITTLWTYTPDDMDKLPERSAKFLGGDFAADYRRYIDAIVEPNKQAQVTNSTQVLGAAVESLSPTEATALVYTNSVATSPVTKGIPSLRYLSYRLSMERRDHQWLITKMTAVTSLDLTPRL